MDDRLLAHHRRGGPAEVKAWGLLLGALAAGAIAACDLPFTGSCSTDFRYGIIVEVRDSVTGAAAAVDARLIVRDGTYADTSDQLPFTDPLILRAAGERGGRYDLTIQKAGYHEWTRAGVRVREDRCHVIPVRLEARLQAAP
jgi:hypothetical protein